MFLDWYLLSSGHDSFNCGLSLPTACNTLDWSLNRLYKSSHQRDKSVYLAVDTNITINAELVVSVTCFFSTVHCRQSLLVGCFGPF